MIIEIWTAITRWFDTQAGQSHIDENSMKVDWLRCIPFFALHFACFGVIWVGFSNTALIFALALYLIRMFAITAFYHRYFSHRAFKTFRWMQFIFAVIGSASVQRGPLWWAAHHRHHHRSSDSPEDIHSPIQSGFLWSHMLWFTNRFNFQTRFYLIEDFRKFPELRWIDRYDIAIPVFLGTLTYGMGEFLEAYFPELKTNGLQLLVWGLISTVTLFHATCMTNSLAHLFGSKRYQTGDNSRNNLFVALLTLGEGWHNNHHHYPNSVQQGFYWWEIDLTYWMLLFLSKLGLVWDLKPVPEKVKNAYL